MQFLYDKNNTKINKIYKLGLNGIEVRIKCGAAAGLVEDGCIKKWTKNIKG